MDIYQEALDKVHHNFITVYRNYIKTDKQDREHYISVLQELVDKETPKEVIYTKGSGDFTKNYPNPYDTYHCPKCNAYLSNKPINFNYCPYCGQRMEKRKKDE